MYNPSVFFALPTFSYLVYRGANKLWLDKLIPNLSVLTGITKMPVLSKMVPLAATVIVNIAFVRLTTPEDSVPSYLAAQEKSKIKREADLHYSVPQAIYTILTVELLATSTLETMLANGWGQFSIEVQMAGHALILAMSHHVISNIGHSISGIAWDSRDRDL